MRTTLTLDEDIAVQLVGACRTSGKSFNEVVNTTLRRGLLESPFAAQQSNAFVVQAQSLGRLKPGIAFDKISLLLDEADGPFYR